MKKKFLFSFLLPFLLVSVNPAYANDTLEYQLATINSGSYVPKDHVTVARFRSLLEQLSETFVENRQQIADMSVTARQLLKKNGIEESLINIMEGLNTIFSIRVDNQKYSEYAAAYVTLRDKGQSHSEAVRGLTEIVRALSIN